MPNNIRRVFVERMGKHDGEAKGLLLDLSNNLELEDLESVHIAYCYDIEGLTEEDYKRVLGTIFKPSPLITIHEGELPIDNGDWVIVSQYIPGQYDQRAQGIESSIHAIVKSQTPRVRATKVVILKGQLDENDYNKAVEYLINPVESILVSLDMPKPLDLHKEEPKEVEVLKGFINSSDKDLSCIMKDMGFAMDMDDLLLCQDYFKNKEKRDPTITEMRMLDTYWSDHCRHTTFMTRLDNIEFEDGLAKDRIAKVFEDYKSSRSYVYGDREKNICLMDMATIVAKEMKKRGILKDLDESEEINACSVVITANIDGRDEEWLLMFKNETHNHPTEIEPFGGASTCLGGCIRDPLSGRSYVYQAMRITGSGDPRQKVEDTLEGKLPQRRITNLAASGYSAYGNLIGLPGGQVVEIYDPGYVAKRMELGAVVAAAPRENVVRKIPKPGDLVILVGGRTGKDGLGGATGSSKGHTEKSLETGGAEVQKGNPAEERKIQRLFRKPKVSKMIKRCNDFGAGGVSVAIGELAPGVLIYLDKVPLKYQGLDGTEIAISESQERMAVVIDENHEEKFIDAARKENLEATTVAIITEEPRLNMKWRGESIVDISREFLDSSGALKSNRVKVISPGDKNSYFDQYKKDNTKDVKDRWLKTLGNLNICSQKGLIQRFDSTVGGGTMLAPLGGENKLTPAEGMAAKLPVMEGETTTGSIMSFGYNPDIFKWSPFHGGIYSIVEALAKITAIGGDYRKIRLTLQEYFERLEDDPEKWGKPFSALLGAYHCQNILNIPAIGGKDSMSGTFNELSVPPTLVAFGVTDYDIKNTTSPEFKEKGSRVVLIPLSKDRWDLPDFEELDKNYKKIYELIDKGKILGAHSVRAGGIAEAISKMAFGNGIGFKFENEISQKDLFSPDYGSIILEINGKESLGELFEEVNYKCLGKTIDEPIISIGSVEISLNEALKAWETPLSSVFHREDPKPIRKLEDISPYNKGPIIGSLGLKTNPKVLIPVFPGTFEEYDLLRAFKRAGGDANTLIFRNLTSKDIEESIDEIEKAIKDAEILVVPGGLSIGDEMEGRSTFPTAALSHPKIFEAIMELKDKRDGLILGIGGGFKTLLDLGLITKEPIDIAMSSSGSHISTIKKTKVLSNLSPWFMNLRVGGIYSTIISHREGDLVMEPETIDKLQVKGQIGSLILSKDGKGYKGIDSLTSEDGKVLGMLGRPERFGKGTLVNIPDKNPINIFKAGVEYFK